MFLIVRSQLLGHTSQKDLLLSLYTEVCPSPDNSYSVYSILLFRVLINTREKNGSLYRVESSVYSMKYKLLKELFILGHQAFQHLDKFLPYYYISENKDCITGTSLQVSGIRGRPQGRLAIFRYILKV